MKSKRLLLPGTYIQGPDALNELPEQIQTFGNSAVIIWDACVKSLFGDKVLSLLSAAGVNGNEFIFPGQTTRNAADQLTRAAQDFPDGFIVGIGGGKTLDIAKAVAAQSRRRMISVPTTASNDSPASSFTVWYTEDGKGDGYDTWGHSPDIVLVDTSIIAKAPLRTFIAGMGDALATWYEAKAVLDAHACNCLGTPATSTAITLAESSRDVLFQYGIDAMESVRRKETSPALEKVVEAAILHSGVGFESGGLATAHQLANNMGILPETHGLLHGEEVAFGLVTQLCLDKRLADDDEHLRVFNFLKQVGLPTTFQQIGISNPAREYLKTLAVLCDGENSFSRNHPFEVTAETIVDAMFLADEIGRNLL